MIRLTLAANYAAQELSEASQTPHGLSADACRELARLLDKAMAAEAPDAPVVAGVVSLAAWREGRRA